MRFARRGTARCGWAATPGWSASTPRGPRTYTTRDGLSLDVIYAIHEDRDGVLWIGTYGGGINRFKDGRFTRYTTKNGLFDDIAYQVLEDREGWLWVTCNKGLMRLSKRELDAVADGGPARFTPSVYGAPDGMLASEFNGSSQPAGWAARDGRLWLPSIKGVIVVEPSALRPNPLPPPVVLEQVRIDRQMVDRSRHVHGRSRLAASSSCATRRSASWRRRRSASRIGSTASTPTGATPAIDAPPTTPTFRPGSYTFRVARRQRRRRLEPAGGDRRHRAAAALLSGHVVPSRFGARRSA